MWTERTPATGPGGMNVPVGSLETSYQRSHAGLESAYAKVGFVNCPVETSLGVLGRKWTLAILRDIGGYGVDRFSGLRRSIPGIPSKVLATRLQQLHRDGFLLRAVGAGRAPRAVRWSLTDKGVDALRVAMMLGGFASKWYADRIFEDRRARAMGEVYSPEALRFFAQVLE